MDCAELKSRAVLDFVWDYRALACVLANALASTCGRVIGAGSKCRNNSRCAPSLLQHRSGPLRAFALVSWVDFSKGKQRPDHDKKQTHLKLSLPGLYKVKKFFIVPSEVQPAAQLGDKFCNLECKIICK